MVQITLRQKIEKEKETNVSFENDGEMEYMMDVEYQ